MKRAIALAGGGPAAGLHIGLLERLAEEVSDPIDFNVWALSSIGAWVGIYYNQFKKTDAAQRTKEFFHDHVFRDDLTYSRFPINRVFAPDFSTNWKAFLHYLTDPKSYRDLWVPGATLQAINELSAFLRNPNKWQEGNFNLWMLNGVLAVNPVVRFLTAMVYLSNVHGLTRVQYEQSTVLNQIKMSKIWNSDKFIYFNAWNLNARRLQLFANRPSEVGDSKSWKYKTMTTDSLCACSALPYIESTVTIDGERYSEGALVDTVNFKALIEDHPDLEEIWVSRIVDANQIREPKNMVEALANLCMQFAAEVGENDVKLFRYHLEESGSKAKLIEVPVSTNINYEWTHSNLEQGIKDGRAAAELKLQERKYVGIVLANATANGMPVSDDLPRYIVTLLELSAGDRANTLDAIVELVSLSGAKLTRANLDGILNKLNFGLPTGSGKGVGGGGAAAVSQSMQRKLNGVVLANARASGLKVSSNLVSYIVTASQLDSRSYRDTLRAIAELSKLSGATVAIDSIEGKLRKLQP